MGTKITARGAGHIVTAGVAAFGLVAAAFLWASAWRSDPLWKPMSRWSRGAGVAILVTGAGGMIALATGATRLRPDRTTDPTVLPLLVRSTRHVRLAGSVPCPRNGTVASDRNVTIQQIATQSPTLAVVVDHGSGPGHDRQGHRPVHVLDLALFLPAVILSGILLLRRTGPGHLTTPAALVFVFATGLPAVATPLLAAAREYHRCGTPSRRWY